MCVNNSSELRSIYALRRRRGPKRWGILGTYTSFRDTSFVASGEQPVRNSVHALLVYGARYHAEGKGIRSDSLVTTISSPELVTLDGPRELSILFEIRMSQARKNAMPCR